VAVAKRRAALGRRRGAGRGQAARGFFFNGETLRIVSIDLLLIRFVDPLALMRGRLSRDLHACLRYSCLGLLRALLLLGDFVSKFDLALLGLLH